MDLQERVALLVEGYQWDSGECEAEARLIAKSILAIPEIRDALSRKVYRRNAPASTIKAQRLKIV